MDPYVLIILIILSPFIIFLIIKFLILFWSYIISEVLANVFIRLYDKYGLKLNFIQTVSNEISYDELDVESQKTIQIE